MLRANESKKQLKNCRYTSKFGILTSVFWIFPQIWGKFIFYIECMWLYLNITSVDIDFIKKSVYIHSIDVINISPKETVSVEVVIFRKTGFRSAKNQGWFQKMMLLLLIFLKKLVLKDGIYRWKQVFYFR